MSQEREGKDYIIRILHERPEIGEGVNFVATYFVREEKEEELIKEIFSKAFSSAHPTWPIRKITVESGHLANNIA